jgi:hypothetical protein
VANRSVGLGLGAWGLVAGLIAGTALASTVAVSPSLLRSWVLPDLDGDGIAERAVFESGAPGIAEQGRVIIFAGNDGAVLAIHDGRLDESDFGQWIGHWPDLDHDGLPELLVASFAQTSDGDRVLRVRVLRPLSGEPLAVLTSSVGMNHFTLAAGFADVVPDGVVDVGDLVEVVNQWVHALPIASADLNQDGVVNLDDADVVIASWGRSVDVPVEMHDVTELAEAGVAMSAAGSASSMPIPGGCGGGFFECLWCWATCGDSLLDAADCGQRYQDYRDNVCGPLADQGKYFEYSACLDYARLNIQAGCVNDVAEAAGDCAPCIYECSPWAVGTGTGGGPCD